MKIENNVLIRAHDSDIKNGKFTVPDSVTSIGEMAFFYCSSLTSITIPASVTSIGDWAFDNCSNLTSVYYTGDIASWFGITFDGRSSNPLEYAHNLYINNELMKDIVIPDTVKEIKKNAFRGWNGTSITIPNSVTSIGSWAFNWCLSLKSITIPDSVTSIGGGAFENCRGLTSVKIGNGITFIGYNTFYRCFSLTSITIPNSVTSIGYGAFFECNNLKSRESSYKAFEIRGGKLFCRKKEYKPDKRNFVQGELILCRRGIHYCTNLFEIFNYYCGEIDKDIAIYEVKPGSRIVEDKYCSKCCTNSIRLVKRLYKEDIIKILNGGKNENENL